MIKKTILVLIGVLLFAASCQQASLFWIISHEVAPKKPVVDGSPSKMVNYQGSLYVANGSLWVFNGSRWTKTAGPYTDGLVNDVAATTNNLYVLIGNKKNGDTEIWGNSGGWTRLTPLDENLAYQALFGANDKLFYSKRTGVPSSGALDYAIHDEAGSLIKSNTGLLRGAVHITYSATDYCFLATEGDGIWVYKPNDDVSATNPARLSGTAGVYFTGIIKTDDTHNIIVAVTYHGNVFQIDGSNQTVITGYPITKVPFTGALALWNNGTASLLLLGVKKSSTYYGYHEMPIVTGQLTGVYHEPGLGSPSSMNSHETYIATIEEHAVNSLMQALNLSEHGLPVVFASTQQNGVWSLRYDTSENENVWNAEE
jgi:hypothetical protein